MAVTPHARQVQIADGAISGHGLNIKAVTGTLEIEVELRDAWGVSDGDNPVFCYTKIKARSFVFSGIASGAMADPGSSVVTVTFLLGSGRSIVGTAFIRVASWTWGQRFKRALGFRGGANVRGSGVFTGSVTFA